MKLFAPLDIKDDNSFILIAENKRNWVATLGNLYWLATIFSHSSNKCKTAVYEEWLAQDWSYDNSLIQIYIQG